MTDYTVKVGDTEFANISLQGIGAVAPAVMVYELGAAASASDTIVFNFPKLNGISIKGAFPVLNTGTAVANPPFTTCVVATGTYLDTVTVTVGTTLAVGDKVVAMALYGV